MKKLGLWIAIAAIAAGGSFLYAHKDGKTMDVDKKVEQLSKKLSLNADQQAKIKAALEEKTQKMEDLAAQMSTLKNECHDGINAVLTDDQKKKFASMKEYRKEDCGTKDGGTCCPMMKK